MHLLYLNFTLCLAMSLNCYRLENCYYSSRHTKNTLSVSICFLKELISSLNTHSKTNNSLNHNVFLHHYNQTKWSPSTLKPGPSIQFQDSVAKSEPGTSGKPNALQVATQMQKEMQRLTLQCQLPEQENHVVVPGS